MSRKDEGAFEIRPERILGNFRPRWPRRRRQRAHLRRGGMSALHRRLIRQLPCCIPGCGHRPPSDPHHLKLGTQERGLGLRATDRWLVPLCRLHHIEVERVGTRHEKRWFCEHHVDCLALASGLWSNRGCIERLQRMLDANRPKELGRAHFGAGPINGAGQ